MNYVPTKNEFVPDLIGGVGVAIGFSSNRLTVKEEKYVYPLESFVAEFGGCLGLFLGFSFLGTFEFIVPIIVKISSRFIKVT